MTAPDGEPRRSPSGTFAETPADLAELEELYARVATWVAGLRDRESGGFFYSRSAASTPGFAPDIESTAMAVRVLAAVGPLAELPEEVTRGVVAFLRARQDPATGYFLDADPAMRQQERLRGRALQMATATLARLGSAPAHPLPAVGTADTAHLASPDAFAAWLDARDWTSSWHAQDNLQAQASLIALLPPKDRDALVEVAIDDVAARQDPGTGFAGDGVPYNRLSGSFKFALFCRAFGREVPRAAEIRAAAFEVIRTEDCLDACWLRNPVELLDVVGTQLGGLTEDERRELTAISTANARRFARTDGGFSRHVDASSPSPNGVRLGLGLAEGDMNATVQLVDIVRPTLYRLNGLEAPPLGPLPADAWSGA
ncbi:hypothetical protein [Miniimonas arenae]|uniref:hypothetical protein n=1 Tax=Miniimonas arenae TaxID=676201 RepID=UPI0028A70BB4|nr:hypothetical protein [Miniimonas arenae]